VLGDQSQGRGNFLNTLIDAAGGLLPVFTS
jgi:hypothetical protein